MENNFAATIHSILAQAEIDYRISIAADYFKGNKSFEGFGNDSEDYNNAKTIVTYFYNKGISMGMLPSKSESRLLLKDIFDKISTKFNITVEFKQTLTPYVFKVSCELFTCFLPLVTVRTLMSILKTFGIKCVAFKKNRSLCNNLDICLTELAYQGKSDIDIPEFKPVADICKKIKGKITPWYKDEVLPVEESDYLSEANARFRGAEWFNEAKKNVTLVGAGGISSNIAVSLCRVLGDNTLTIWDADTVEHKNLAGQNFGISDIGKSKAGVVAEQSVNFNPIIKVNAFGRFDESSHADDITITGLDNMATRKLVFYKWLNTEPTEENVDFIDFANSRRLLIDARLSAEKWQIFCITGNNKVAQKEYEDKWLFDDDEADSDVCSYKQTAYAAQMCASFVTNLYINFCTNLLKDKDDPTRRYLPFMIEYDASQMHFKSREVI